MALSSLPGVSPRSQVMILAAVLVSPLTSLAGQQDSDAPLDSRRKAVLKAIAQIERYRPGPEDPAYPKPNLTMTGRDHVERWWFYERVIALLALVDMNEAPKSRIEEANRLLRYELNRWPCQGISDLIGLGAPTWNLSHRNRALRIYGLFSRYLDVDIREEFLRRFRYMAGEVWDELSENHKYSANSAIFLAHEFTGRTSAPTYRKAADYLIRYMRRTGTRGFDEWGSAYQGLITNGAILNLADCAQEPVVKNFAILLMDFCLAQQSGFSIGGKVNSSGIRRYVFDLCGRGRSFIPYQTSIDQLLITGIQSEEMEGRMYPIEFAASNYRPLAIVGSLYMRRQPTRKRN